MSDRQWCESCREIVYDDEVSLECMHLDCPIAEMRRVNQGGAKPMSDQIKLAAARAVLRNVIIP